MKKETINLYISLLIIINIAIKMFDWSLNGDLLLGLEILRTIQLKIEVLHQNMLCLCMNMYII